MTALTGEPVAYEPFCHADDHIHLSCLQTKHVQDPALHSSDSELRNSDTPEKVDKAKGAASEEKSDDDGEPDPDDESDLPLLPPHTIVEGHVISQRRPVTQAERDRTLLAAKAFPATNPKLVVVMTRGYVYRGFWLVSPCLGSTV